MDNDGSEDEDMQSIEEVAPSTRVDMYPQVGLHTPGHFKATGMPKGFQPILKKLDCQWAKRMNIHTPIICGYESLCNKESFS
jgi:hypothetical protein